MVKECQKRSKLSYFSNNWANGTNCPKMGFYCYNVLKQFKISTRQICTFLTHIVHFSHVHDYINVGNDCQKQSVIYDFLHKSKNREINLLIKRKDFAKENVRQFSMLCLQAKPFLKKEIWSIHCVAHDIKVVLYRLSNYPKLPDTRYLQFWKYPKLPDTRSYYMRVPESSINEDLLVKTSPDIPYLVPIVPDYPTTH